MGSELATILRLVAYEKGRAIPMATHRQVAIRDEALVMAPIAMAGEATTIHAIAIGRVGGPPRIRVVPDPRDREALAGLFAWLGGGLEKYFESCDGHPQAWVSSRAAVALLDTLAERCRYDRERPEVRAFGERLSYFTDRAPVSGQQALHAATDVLGRHWATGQASSEDEHLGSFLVWLDPPPGGAAGLRRALREAELEPAGANTRPDFDRERLEPLVTASNIARREGAPPDELAELSEAIEDALAPVALAIYEKTQRAIALLRGSELPPMPQLEELEKREADAFRGFQKARREGRFLTLRDRPKAAAFRMATREDAEANAEASLRSGDGVARAAAALSGGALEGVVRGPEKRRRGPRSFDHLFEIQSEQAVLHLREGDRLFKDGDRRHCAEVLGFERLGAAATVRLKLVKGQKLFGLPADGEEQCWLSKATDWGRIFKERKQYALRLGETPWTHDPERPRPEGHPRPAPADPLALIEEAR